MSQPDPEHDDLINTKSEVSGSYAEDPSADILGDEEVERLDYDDLTERGEETGPRTEDGRQASDNDKKENE